MAANELPSHEVLRQLFEYDAGTGELTWKKRDVSLFNETEARTAKHACSHWNSRFAGKPALTALTRGYKGGRAIGYKLAAHRVAWKLVHGVEPEYVDHINGDPTDNRLVNLRSVSHLVNMRNRKVGVKNTSGIVGVFWLKPLSKWQSYIYLNGRKKILGYFIEKSDAADARYRAEAAEGFITRI